MIKWKDEEETDEQWSNRTNDSYNCDKAGRVFWNEIKTAGSQGSIPPRLVKSKRLERISIRRGGRHDDPILRFSFTFVQNSIKTIVFIER